MLQMFVLALSLYNTWNRGVFLLCKITNLLIYSKYSQLINSSSYKVNDTEFGYFILNCGKRKELVPVWVIFIKESTKEKEYEYQELYNALTGEEIVL